MFIVKYYIAAALLAFLGAFLVPSFIVALPLIWIALSLSAVCVAYITENPGVFRKKTNGSIPFYIRWLFIPFLVGCQLYNLFRRKRDSVPSIQKINDNLYLACRLFSSDIEFLQKSNVTAILDVTAEFGGLDWTAQSENLDYLNIPVLDHQSPKSSDLVKAVNWIKNHIDNNKGVVVHCALGRGRSVLVVAAYLLSRNKQLSVSEVINQIKHVRETAGLNPHQLKKLEKMHKSGALKHANKLAIIANPVSGGGKWLASKDEIIQRLTPHFNLMIFETTKEVSAAKLSEQAIEQGAQIIVGCGGDGTISEVASKVVNTALSFGIIPMGTANALSHALYGANTKIIPVSLACDIIIHGHIMKIDTAMCNDELMLMVAGIGLEQQMIERADRDEKNEGGQFAYLKSLWQAIEDNEHKQLIVKIDNDKEHEFQTSSLIIANAAPFSTVLAQGGGEPDVRDGKLDITWLAQNDSVSDQLFNIAELAFSVVTDAIENNKIMHLRASSIEIRSTDSLKYVLDGENREGDKLTINIQPASLRIFSEIY